MEYEDAIALYFGDAARADYEWNRRYAAYIASAAWQLKRLQKLLSVVGVAADAYYTMDWLTQNASRYAFRCERCGAAENHDQIRVHHRHYRSLGNESLGDLVVLCPFCQDALLKVARATGLDVEVVTTRLLVGLPA